MDRQTDRRTDRWTDRQTDRLTYGQLQTVVIALSTVFEFVQFAKLFKGKNDHRYDFRLQIHIFCVPPSHVLSQYVVTLMKTLTAP